MKEIIRMVVVLSAIAGLSGFILSGLKVVTDPIIEENVINHVQGPALKQIFLQDNNDYITHRKRITMPCTGQTVLLFPLLKDGNLKAVALEASGKGYGGEIKVIVGFDVATDKLIGISVTTHKETPGLGSAVQDAAFTKQFQGKEPARASLRKDGGDIDAVSGATLSSVAVCNAVKQAASCYAALKDTIKATQW